MTVVTFRQLTVEALLEQVAARTPTPGGGAVAAITAALAAALGEMVVNHSQGDLASGAAELASLRSRALDLADADAEAFGALSALWKLPRDDERRRAGWTAAVEAAIEAPSRVMEVAAGVLGVLHAPGLNPNLASDLLISARLAEAAAHAAAANVRINLPLLGDPARAADLEAATQGRLDAIAHDAAAVSSRALS